MYLETLEHLTDARRSMSTHSHKTKAMTLLNETIAMHTVFFQQWFMAQVINLDTNVVDTFLRVAIDLNTPYLTTASSPKTLEALDAVICETFRHIKFNSGKELVQPDMREWKEWREQLPKQFNRSRAMLKDLLDMAKDLTEPVKQTSSPVRGRPFHCWTRLTSY